MSCGDQFCAPLLRIGTAGENVAEAHAAAADSALMSVSAVGSSPSAASFETEREISVMKKTKDVEKQTAESLIELVKKAPQAAPGRIDTYA